MQIGVLLPSFDVTPEPALAQAVLAEQAGLHGVFCYDHLWPIGHPGEPAISPYPLLAAIGLETKRIRLGTLVARVGLEPDTVLAAKLETLAELLPGRFIAGLGTGDQKSEKENLAYGIAPGPPDLRRQSLEHVSELLAPSGVEIWIGGGSRATNEVARRLGMMLNLWAASTELIAEAAREGPVSWGGALPDGSSEAAAKLATLATAGASWAAISWRGDLAPLVAAIGLAGIELVG